MSSGVKVGKDCTEQFEELKMGKKYRYILFKLNDKLTQIDVDYCSPRDATYDEMKAQLLALGEERHCRFAVFDLEFDFNGKQKQKLAFISWAPENSILKEKMVYTSSKDYLKKALQLVNEVQATDAEELSIECAIEKCSRGMKD